MRVVRVELSNGERLIGLRYPAILLPLVDDTLKQQKLIQRVQARLQMGTNGVQIDPASIGQTSDQPKPSVLEPETAVIPKLLKKAMMPPNTLRNYFKRRESGEAQEASDQRLKVTSPVNTSETSKASDSEVDSDECTVIEDKEETADSGKKRKKLRCSERIKKKRKSMNAGEENAESEKENQKSPGTSKKEAETKSSDTKTIKEMPLGEKIAKETAPLGTSLQTPSREQRAESSIQRPSPVTATTVVKRTKQTNIASMFAKKKTAEEKKLQCPICSQEMPSKMSNKDFNDHIDQCLLQS